MCYGWIKGDDSCKIQQLDGIIFKDMKYFLTAEI